MPTAAPFGSWPSPVSAELIAGATIRLGQTAIRGDEIFWTEGRPQEQGRNVLVRRGRDGALHDVNPAPFNLRTRAHEYGGGAFVLQDDGVVFSHYDDQQLYRVDSAGAPQPLTQEAGQRYADATVDRQRNRLIAVREDHRVSDLDAAATLVAIALDTGVAEVLVAGHDFFSSPVLSPDGRQLAWLSWDHPNMPWDGSQLWLAEIGPDGTLSAPELIAGGADESIFQPSWSPSGELHFASDRSGWWNLHRRRDGLTSPLQPMAAEFGVAQWAFGMSQYGFDASGRIVCAYQQGGVSHLAILDAESGHFETLPTPFCAIGELRVGGDFAVFIGATATEASAVVRFDLRSRSHQVLRRSSTAAIDPAYFSKAEAISFPTEGGLQAHAFFYPPTHPDFSGPAGEKPPLIVISHGGPTGSTDAAFKWAYQFWTSRGFGIVDVNYGGSTGYGRAYRERLAGRWGVVDVDDSVNAAKYLIARGDADANRAIVRGGSAGGYTTLCALTFRRFFKAGASHYGIGDLEALVEDTHKFESRYLDRLIGPYPGAKALYIARSPIHHTDQLASPMILFQGAEDKAVPPEQAQAMFDAVDAKGLPVALLMFEGEQHGFRRATTIRRVLEAELYFYGRVFGFEPAEAVDPVEIRNLPPKPLPRSLADPSWNPVFVDANTTLASAVENLRSADDLPWRINLQEDLDPDRLPALLGDARIVIIDHTPLPTAVAEACEGLKHVVFLGTGARSYMNSEQLAALGIEVHTIKGYGDTAVAECAFALMWAAAKGFGRMDRGMRAGQWLRTDAIQLTGRTLGLIGFGGIAQELARLALGAGMRVIAWNRSPKECAGVEFVTIDELLARSDVVSLHLLLTEETRGFLSRERIAAMRDGSILINTARGALVDEAALVDALRSGKLAHAGLDVFTTEPLPPGHPLTELDNVTLSAHSAFRTPEANDNLVAAALAHCRRIVAQAAEGGAA